MDRYSAFRLLKEGLAGHAGWRPAWRSPQPKPRYDVVVVGGWMHNPQPNAPCAASLVGRTVTVRLAKPLSDRVILDAATGWPVSQLPVFAKLVPK